MTNSLNLSQVIECVKNIVESVRCTVCDKAKGGRVRYPCGHTTCDGCLTVAEGCMLCLTPPSTLNKPADDEPLTKRANNASTLLSVCEETFNLDVYRRLRKSEQLKAEKELFPKCIQAPVKYTNKRKSSSALNKENQGFLFYPGENISQSDTFKMNKRNNYVKQWLNNSENKPRKALGDLQVNNDNNMKRSVDNKKKVKQNAVNVTKNRKRSHSNNSYSLIDNFKESEYMFKKNKSDDFDTIKDGMDKNILNKNVNDESGIEMNDEPILIEDSQSQLIDKDALALLAVAAADIEHTDYTASFEDSGFERHEKNSPNVPFLKKGSFLNSCVTCKKNDNNDDENDSTSVSVTIENDSFITTINISKINEVTHCKNSVHVQTDISDVSIDGKVNINNVNPDINVMKNKDLILKTESNALDNNHLKPEVKERELKSPNIFETCEAASIEKSHIVIDDSDSDVSSEEVSFLQVSADVHRSCEPVDYGILSEIDTNQLLKRPRNKLRGVTPDSSNSSDKENCDPNKSKKFKSSKKKGNKK